MATADYGLIQGYRGFGGALKDAALMKMKQQQMEQEALLNQAKIIAAQQGGELPANVREYQFYNSLPQNEQANYLQMKRADKFLDTGAGFVRTDPRTGQVMPVTYGAGGLLEKGLTPEQQREAELKAREEQDLFNRGLDVKQKALDATQRLLKNEEGVRANRGGISTLFPNISNSAVDAAADLDTVSNLLTTENLGLLKGVLSDTDMKVLASIGSGELAGSDEKALGALKRMREALSGQVLGMRAAKQDLQQGQLPPLKSDFIDMPNTFAPEAGAPIIDPQTRAVGGVPTIKAGTIKYGYKFLGGNPADQSRWKKVK